LMADHPEPARIMDAPAGVLVEGLRSLNVASAEEAARALEMAKRRQDPAARAKAVSVVALDVTQADYFAGWGLFGRLRIIECPAMDCLAEDRGLVQLREGFDTFRGVFHLRSLVQGWRPLVPGDVHGSVLTWLLRDTLCGGSVSTTLLMCLKQQQPTVSQTLMEFVDAFGKIETHPVCCDHRVSGLLRAMRAELLVFTRGGKARAREEDRDKDEDTRRIILELEKRLQAAERGREDAIRQEEMKQGRASDYKDRFAGAIHGQEVMHDRLVNAEEEHLRACEGLVEVQLEHTEVKEELGECQYKDNLMFMVLEEEVADLQKAELQGHSLAEQFEDALHEERAEHSSLQQKYEELVVTPPTNVLESLQGELATERRELANSHAEFKAESQRRAIEQKRLEAELMELRSFGANAHSAAGHYGQQYLQEAVPNPIGGGDAQVLEENRMLRRRVDDLERKLPEDQRLTAQRLAILEKSARTLEAERTELLVRATVAEEQLTQLQRHLKEMTEGYQMQILQLKLNAKGK